MATTDLLLIAAAVLAAIGVGAVAAADHPPEPGSWRSRLYPAVVTAAAAATIVAEVIAWAHPAPTSGLLLSAAAVLLAIAGWRRMHAQQELLDTLRRRLTETRKHRR